MAVLLHLLFLINVSGPERPPPGETKETGKRCRGEKKNQQEMRAQPSLGDQSIGFPRQSNLKWQQSSKMFLSLSRPRWTRDFAPGNERFRRSATSLSGKPPISDSRSASR